MAADVSAIRGQKCRPARGDVPLLEAIAAYENQVRDYGFAAVAAAGQNTRDMWAQRHPILARLVRLLQPAR